MFKIVISILLLSSFFYGKVLRLSQEDIHYIKDHPNKNKIVHRFKLLNILTNSSSDLSPQQKLYRVNHFFNKLLYKDDMEGFDHWSTVGEFLIEGRGDCEDYAIAKYFTLIQMGFSKKDFYFALFKIKGSLSYHINLLYFPPNITTPLVLDNMSSKILPLQRKQHLIPHYAFNEYTFNKLTLNGLGERIGTSPRSIDKWNNLLDRVYTKSRIN